jgi:hypothetical protein
MEVSRWNALAKRVSSTISYHSSTRPRWRLEIVATLQRFYNRCEEVPGLWS